VQKEIMTFNPVELGKRMIEDGLMAKKGFVKRSKNRKL
jgi:hypothetical protein